MQSGCRYVSACIIDCGVQNFFSHSALHPRLLTCCAYVVLDFVKEFVKRSGCQNI